MRLREARLAVGLSQADAAESLNVSKAAISNWERGAHAVDESRMLDIARLYRTSPSYLRYGEEGRSGGRNDSKPSRGRGREYSPRAFKRRGAEPTSTMLPQNARVWLQEFLLELTRAEASEAEVESARELLTSRAAFELCSTQGAGSSDDQELLDGLQRLADFIRAQLRARGRSL